MDLYTAKGSKLELSRADAGGPFGLGHERGVLT